MRAAAGHFSPRYFAGTDLRGALDLGSPLVAGTSRPRTLRAVRGGTCARCRGLRGDAAGRRGCEIPRSIPARGIGNISQTPRTEVELDGDRHAGAVHGLWVCSTCVPSARGLWPRIAALRLSLPGGRPRAVPALGTETTLLRIPSPGLTTAREAIQLRCPTKPGRFLVRNLSWPRFIAGCTGEAGKSLTSPSPSEMGIAGRGSARTQGDNTFFAALRQAKGSPHAGVRVHPALELR